MHIDTAGDVHGDHRDSGPFYVVEDRGGHWPQRARAGDAHHPVDHQIRCCRHILHHPATGGPKGGQRSGVGVLGVQQDRTRRRAPAAQESRRPECVAAVVPGSHYRADGAAGQSSGSRAQFGGDRVGQAGGGAAHKRTVGQAGQQRGLGHPDLLGGVVVPHLMRR